MIKPLINQSVIYSNNKSNNIRMGCISHKICWRFVLICFIVDMSAGLWSLLGVFTRISYDDYGDATWASWRLQSPVIRLFVQQFVQVDIKGNIGAPHHRSRARGIHWWQVDSHQKGLVMQKAFPFHDVIMSTHGCLVHAKLTDIESQRNTAMCASFLRFTVHQCFIRYIFDVYEIHKMFCYWMLPLGYQSR